MSTGIKNVANLAGLLYFLSLLWLSSRRRSLNSTTDVVKRLEDALGQSLPRKNSLATHSPCRPPMQPGTGICVVAQISCPTINCSVSSRRTRIWIFSVAVVAEPYLAHKTLFHAVHQTVHKQHLEKFIASYFIVYSFQTK